MRLSLDDVSDVIATLITAEVQPLRQKVADFESRPQPRDERYADHSEVMTLKAEIGRLHGVIEAMRAAMPDVDAIVKEAVADAIAKLPAPQRGKDGEPGQPGASVTVDDVRPVITAEVAKAVSIIEPKNVEEIVKTAVVDAVAQLPPPQPGKPGEPGVSVTVEDVRPVITEEVTKVVAALPKPKDAIGLMGTFIDREGHLLVTLSDGTTKDVGPVVGKDVDMDVVEQAIVREVAKLPAPKDGKDGKDGRDGVNFDDIDVEYDELGRMFLKAVKGDYVKTWRIPGIVHRGVWRDSESYEKGDAVTFGGSTFIATAQTTSKPETDKTWQLSTKRGRDGKDGKPGVDGKPGRDGKDGQWR